MAAPISGLVEFRFVRAPVGMAQASIDSLLFQPGGGLRIGLVHWQYGGLGLAFGGMFAGLLALAMRRHQKE